MQACGAGREMRQIVKFCKKIQMNQKETFNSTVKDHDLNLLVSFDCRDDLVHLRKHLRIEDAKRWMVERHSPIMGRELLYRYSLRYRWRLSLSLCCHFESPQFDQFVNTSLDLTGLCSIGLPAN